MGAPPASNPRGGANAHEAATDKFGAVYNRDPVIRSAGLLVGPAAEVGIVRGAAYARSFAGGVALDGGNLEGVSWTSVGYFEDITGRSAPGKGEFAQFVLGAAVGVNGQIWWSNASKEVQLYGPFEQANVSLASLGTSLAWDPHSGIWVISAGISKAPFSAVSVSEFRTITTSWKDALP
jgi:hypothetical protein